MKNQKAIHSPARLIIKNIGNINNADITINDNCVIAGHNNIGKSTITKILYSIVRCVTNSDKIYNDFMSKIEGISDDEKVLELIEKYK